MADYQLEFLKVAALDLEEIGDWYNHQNVVGLAERFWQKTNLALGQLTKHPFSHPICFENEPFRRAKVPRFPYSLYYEVNEGQRLITITAIVHQHRSEAFIRSRLNRE